MFGNRPDEVSVTSHSMDRGDPSATGSAAHMSSAAKWPPLAPALPYASNGVITKLARAPASHILTVGAFLLGCHSTLIITVTACASPVVHHP